MNRKDNLSTSKSQRIFFLLGILLIMLIAFAAGVISDQIFFTEQKSYPLFGEAFRLLKENGLKPLPEDRQIEYGMIRGLFETYDDPYTVLFEPPENEIQTNNLQGKYGGIGARIEQNADKQYLLFPYAGSPAQEAGILDGDRLIQVDLLVIEAETSSNEVEASLRGLEGSFVTVFIRRASSETDLTFKIRRKEFPLPSVSWYRMPENPKVGIVHVTLIAETTPDEVKKAFADLQIQGAVQFILDLRDNSGGLVDAGVNTARLFLKTGTVIQQQYHNQPVRTFTVDEPGVLADLPLILLVNHGTASAAEIITAALRAQNRAQVVGTPTYGKNSIQLIFPLQDTSSVHITSAIWWAPALGYDTNEKGIQPDVILGDEEVNTSSAIQSAAQLFTP